MAQIRNGDIVRLNPPKMSGDSPKAIESFGRWVRFSGYIGIVADVRNDEYLVRIHHISLKALRKDPSKYDDQDWFKRSELTLLDPRTLKP